uniref:Uncharacterized protein n=1 Tax=Ditylenchus dipsaci TaxID=166011 RepID=A0A915EP87_9BILA
MLSNCSVERLAHKITQAEFKPDTGSLEENNMRKAFKSCNIIDQHSLDRQTLPNSLYDLYQKCDAPPQLDHLNPYRDDSKSALRYYTDPATSLICGNKRC